MCISKHLTCGILDFGVVPLSVTTRGGGTARPPVYPRPPITDPSLSISFAVADP